MKILHIIAFILLAVGGVNWGLVGLSMFVNGDMTSWNVMHMLLGFSMQLEAIVYILVGVSAVWLLITHRKDCKTCSM